MRLELRFYFKKDNQRLLGYIHEVPTQKIFLLVILLVRWAVVFSWFRTFEFRS